MPFGRLKSEDFEMSRALPGLVLAQPRSAAHRLAHCSRTTARPPPASRHLAPGPLQKTFGQLLLLMRAQQIAAPHQGSHQGHIHSRLEEARAPHRRLGGRRCALGSRRRVHQRNFCVPSSATSRRPRQVHGVAAAPGGRALPHRRSPMATCLGYAARITA